MGRGGREDGKLEPPPYPPYPPFPPFHPHSSFSVHYPSDIFQSGNFVFELRGQEGGQGGGKSRCAFARCNHCHQKKLDNIQKIQRKFQLEAVDGADGVPRHLPGFRSSVDRFVVGLQSPCSRWRCCRHLLGGMNGKGGGGGR